ncbi:MAG: hypothetical protein HOV79_18455 [Hamadaea sp.]|nr:hypothetical protein [Hamadaea sp.]
MSAIVYEADVRSRRFAALGDSLWVLKQAAILFGRHWPVLATISFGGVAAHGLLIDAAVKAAQVHTTLGLMVLVLAPISTLTALVLMLRVVRQSLPYLGAGDPQTGRRTNLLDFVGSVAVPYLAIYAAYGYMEADVSRFAYESWRATNFFDSALAPLPFSPTVSLIGVVVVAIVIRALITRSVPIVGEVVPMGGPPAAGGWRQHPIIKALGAYVEVIWVATLVMGLNRARNGFGGWFGEREVSTWLDRALAALPGTRIGEVIGEWLGIVWANLDIVILAPIAWLTMGAVVYGRRIEEHRLTDDELMTSAARRLQRTRGLRAVARPLTAEMHRRFGPLLGSLRLLARAGLRPMLLFCVVFVLVQISKAGMWELERFLIGPRDLNDFWVPASYMLSEVNAALNYVLLICLLGAATDRILQSRDNA